MANELETVKPEKNLLMIHGKEREIKFNFSAWAKLEKEYDGLQNIEQLEKQMAETPFNTIPHLLYIGLLDKEGVTEENILDEYGIEDLEIIKTVFQKALYGSLPIDEGKNTEAEAKK